MIGKSDIVFLKVPDYLGKKIKHFDINPSILIPVEIDDGGTELDLNDLSWEMILSGMLRIISAFKDNNPLENFVDSLKIGIRHGDRVKEDDIEKIPGDWVDYYRSFVLSAKPEIYHEFTNAAIVKAGNGEYDQALEINDILEGLFPRSPGVLLNKALIQEDKARALDKSGHRSERENDLALKAYEKALTTKPVLADTYFNAAYFFMGLRDFERAKACFTRYVSLGEKAEGSEKTPDSLGVSLEKIQEAKKVISHISGQGLADENFREGYDLINRGMDQEGLVHIRKFIEKYPKVRNGWFVLGWALRKLGRFGDALEAFNKARELGGYDIDLRNEMAICHMELGDLKAAQKELEEALREDPESIKIISNLGVLALKRGNNSEAEAFFRTLLELDPKDPLALHYLNPGGLE